MENTQLYIKGSLKKKDGTNIDDDAQVELTNNALYSLIDSVTFYIGNNQQEIYYPNYAYTSYLRQLMRNIGNRPDSKSQMMEIETRVYKSDYLMGETRKLYVAKSKSVEMLGPLLTDFSLCKTFLLPATPLRIRFRKAREEFYIITSETGKTQSYEFVIDKICLYTPAININSYLSPYFEDLLEDAPARYEFQALSIKQFTLPKDTLVQKYSRIFEGKLPTKLMVGVYLQSAFCGDKTLTPLLTHNTKMREISLLVNGVTAKSINVNMADDMYSDAYYKFLHWMGGYDMDFCIPQETYKHGYEFYAFDMMEHACRGQCTEEILHQGFMDIVLHLSEKLDEHCVLLVYYQAPESIEILQERAARHIKTVI